MCIRDSPNAVPVADQADEQHTEQGDGAAVRHMEYPYVGSDESKGHGGSAEYQLFGGQLCFSVPGDQACDQKQDEGGKDAQYVTKCGQTAVWGNNRHKKSSFVVYTGGDYLEVLSFLTPV